MPMYDIIILGGGAAGLAAMSYTLSKQLKTLMIYDVLGGKASWRLKIRETQQEFEPLVGYTIPAQQPVGTTKLVGEEAVRIFVQQVHAHEGTTVHDHITKVSRLDNTFFVETGKNDVYRAKAIIVATGVTPRHLDVPGAQEFVGMGIGYSPTTNTRLAQNKRIALIGSTMRILHAANEMAPAVKSLYLIIPERGSVSSTILNTLGDHATIQIFDGAQIQSVTGSETAEQIILTHNGNQQTLEIDMAFVDLGLTPNTGILQHLDVLDDQGFVRVDHRAATDVPGLFAAGDVTTNFGEQVLIAIGEGARAALSAYDYLLEQRATQGG